MLDFKILGPLEVERDGYSLPLGGAKPKAVLAILILHASHLVTQDGLIDRIWEEDPPTAATNVLHTYVSRLRRALGTKKTPGQQIIKSRSSGYVLDVPRDSIDLRRFEVALSRARAALETDRPAESSDVVSEALSYFRGPALADFQYEPWASTEIRRIEELRLEGMETKFEADLILGRHSQLIGELESLVKSNPLREALIAQLMLALYRTGRQADALAVIREARRALAEELGIDPSSALEKLEHQILTQDPEIEWKRSGIHTPPPASKTTINVEGLEVASASPSQAAVDPRLLETSSQEAADAETSELIVRGRRRRLVVPIASLAVAVAVALLVGRSGEEGVPSPPIQRPVTSLLRIDPESGEISRLVRDLQGRTDRNWISSLEIGEGGVWYVDEQLHHIDPVTGREIATHVLSDAYDSVVTVGQREVWVATSTELLKIDPAGDEELQRTELHLSSGPATGYGPTAIATDNRSVWLSWEDGSVFRFDFDGKLQGKIHAAELASDVVVAGGQVWVSDPFAGEVIAIDPASRRVRARIDVGGSPLALTTLGDDLWVLDEAGILTAVDLHSHSVGVGIRMGPRPVDLAATENAVWVVDGEDGRLRTISPLQQRIVGIVDLNVPLGTVAVDSETGLVWIRTTRPGGG